MSVCTSTQWMLSLPCLQRNSRKCNDLNKRYDPSCLSFKSMQRMHKQTHEEKETCGLMSYLIQFLGLWFEPTHVDGKVAVLLLQQLHPKNTKSCLSVCAGHPWRNSFRQMSAVYAVAPRAADYGSNRSLCLACSFLYAEYFLSAGRLISVHLHWSRSRLNSPLLDFCKNNMNGAEVNLITCAFLTGWIAALSVCSCLAPSYCRPLDVAWAPLSHFVPLVSPGLSAAPPVRWPWDDDTWHSYVLNQRMLSCVIFLPRDCLIGSQGEKQWAFLEDTGTLVH